MKFSGRSIEKCQSSGLPVAKVLFYKKNDFSTVIDSNYLALVLRSMVTEVVSLSCT
jgi:hypothetical protein